MEDSGQDAFRPQGNGLGGMNRILGPGSCGLSFCKGGLGCRAVPLALVGKRFLVLWTLPLLRPLVIGMCATLLGAAALRAAPRLGVAGLARPGIGRLDADILVVGLAHGRG